MTTASLAPPGVVTALNSSGGMYGKIPPINWQPIVPPTLRDTGGIPERCRRGPLRRRGAARDGRSRGRYPRGPPDQGSGSGSTSVTSSSRTTTSSVTASMSRRAWKRSRSRAGSASRGWCETRSATSWPTLSEDRGEQSVKNIARPVRVYALSPEAVADLPAFERAACSANLSARRPTLDRGYETSSG
jgi:hypothetical protein